ncbi:MAG: hypothetical protein AB8F65_06125 [Woeseiaceae bacterium]
MSIARYIDAEMAEPFSEFDLAWIRRRTQALIAEDLVPAAAKIIAAQEVLKRRRCQGTSSTGA